MTNTASNISLSPGTITEANLGGREDLVHGSGPTAQDQSLCLFKGQYEEASLLSSQTSEHPLSKNQQKKLRRRQEWEANRESRKTRRKERTKARKEKKRSMMHYESNRHEQTSYKNVAAVKDSCRDGEYTLPAQTQVRGIQMPITFVIDCQFDDLMLEHERTSLGGQITRCYSDNRKSPYRAHLAVSSFNGKLKDRFESVLSNSHESWTGVRFFAEGFVEVARISKAWMHHSSNCSQIENHVNTDKLNQDSEDGEVVYLSSESPNTLAELKANSVYIIGGLVDHNRHKGICYKRAVDLEVKTAKLPIGEFVNLQSRAVLATNHVVEIMLKWMELRDWGRAFMAAIPKRKGIVLKRSA